MVWGSLTNTYLEHTWIATISPKRTLRLFRTTLFILIFSSEMVSSERTMQTVSFLFLPYK